MKYDIAKNEDGPLRKTVKSQKDVPREPEVTARTATVDQPDIPTSERYPGLDERLQNLETHLAVRYGK